MRASFVHYVTERFLLADLAYETLDRGWIGAASGVGVRSIVSTLLPASRNRPRGPKGVDRSLERACATGLLSIEGDIVRWRSARTQVYLAALGLCGRYLRERHRGWRLSSENEQRADDLLQEKAALPRWHEPVTILIGHHIEEDEQICRVVELLASTTPSLATWYRERLEGGFFGAPWPERKFLGEIAWPLGGVEFWTDALQDSDPDTRHQAALILGLARIAGVEGPLLCLLSDDDVQVRARTVWALGRVGSIEDVGSLIRMLEDPSRRVRFQARRALALVQGEEGENEFTLPSWAEQAGKRVLFSDDDPGLVDLYKLILKRVGYDMLSAPGGERTLELARRQQPDLVATDILNPHMMGTDLVRKLRDDPATREIPIVLVTAHTRQLCWLGSFWGADVTLHKPFGPREILTLLDEMILG